MDAAEGAGTGASGLAAATFAWHAASTSASEGCPADGHEPCALADASAQSATDARPRPRRRTACRRSPRSAGHRVHLDVHLEPPLRVAAILARRRDEVDDQPVDPTHRRAVTREPVVLNAVVADAVTTEPTPTRPPRGRLASTSSTVIVMSAETTILGRFAVASALTATDSTYTRAVAAPTAVLACTSAQGAAIRRTSFPAELERGGLARVRVRLRPRRLGDGVRGARERKRRHLAEHRALPGRLRRVREVEARRRGAVFPRAVVSFPRPAVARVVHEAPLQRVPRRVAAKVVRADAQRRHPRRVRRVRVRNRRLRVPPLAPPPVPRESHRFASKRARIRRVVALVAPRLGERRAVREIGPGGARAAARPLEPGGALTRPVRRAHAAPAAVRLRIARVLARRPDEPRVADTSRARRCTRRSRRTRSPPPASEGAGVSHRAPPNPGAHSHSAVMSLHVPPFRHAHVLHPWPVNPPLHRQSASPATGSNTQRPRVGGHAPAQRTSPARTTRRRVRANPRVARADARGGVAGSPPAARHRLGRAERRVQRVRARAGAGRVAVGAPPPLAARTDSRRRRVPRRAPCKTASSPP